MKNLKSAIITLLLLALVCTLFACGANENPEESQTSGMSVQENEATSDVDVATIVLDLEEAIDKGPEKDMWDVIRIKNDVPFTPEGYEGPVCDYVGKYTGENGEAVEMVFNDMAFVCDDTYGVQDYGQEYNIWREQTIDGETLPGYFLLRSEYKYFLEHTKGETTELLYLNVDLPFLVHYPSLVDHTESKALIQMGSYLITYSFESKECKTISDSVLTYSYPEGDVVYFTDWDHVEHQCKWIETEESTETGNTVISYRIKVGQLVKNEEFQQEFLTMQEALKTGKATKDSFADKYYISYIGSIFSQATDEYLGNIHMPYASNWCSGAIWGDYNSCWNVENTKLTLARYGEVVRFYYLPESEWKMVEAYIQVRQKPDTVFVEYDVDANSDGLISAEELENAIVGCNILLLNVEERSLYRIDTEGNFDKIASDVTDYCEAYGEMYWMDSNCNAYELSWLEDDDSILIGENVVGISKHTDERAGFMVMPGDPRCNFADEGFYFCTLYGREWLNQEKTSGAWALEHDWK